MAGAMRGQEGASLKKVGPPGASRGLCELLRAVVTLWLTRPVRFVAYRGRLVLQPDRPVSPALLIM